MNGQGVISPGSGIKQSHLLCAVVCATDRPDRTWLFLFLLITPSVYCHHILISKIAETAISDDDGKSHKDCVDRLEITTKFTQKWEVCLKIHFRVVTINSRYLKYPGSDYKIKQWNKKIHKHSKAYICLILSKRHQCIFALNSFLSRTYPGSGVHINPPLQLLAII